MVAAAPCMNDWAPPKQKPTVTIVPRRSRRAGGSIAARDVLRRPCSGVRLLRRAACTRSPRRAGRARPCGRSSRIAIAEWPAAREALGQLLVEAEQAAHVRAARRRRSGPRRARQVRGERRVPSAEVSVERLAGGAAGASGAAGRGCRGGDRVEGASTCRERSSGAACAPPAGSTDAARRRPAPRPGLLAAARPALHCRTSRRYGSRLIERIEALTEGALRGEPEHDVPAAALAGGAGAAGRPLGAPGAPLPALLPAPTSAGRGRSAAALAGELAPRLDRDRARAIRAVRLPRLLDRA